MSVPPFVHVHFHAIVIFSSLPMPVLVICRPEDLSTLVCLSTEEEGRVGCSATAYMCARVAGLGRAGSRAAYACPSLQPAGSWHMPTSLDEGTGGGKCGRLSREGGGSHRTDMRRCARHASYKKLVKAQHSVPAKKALPESNNYMSRRLSAATVRMLESCMQPCWQRF